MPGMHAMIIGHSLCARLCSDLISGVDPKMTSSFNLIRKVDQISFLGRVGKRVANVENEDLQQICDICPDIVALIIGENDVRVDTDPKGLAGRIMSLATLLCNHGYTQHVVICKLLPRFRAPRCILQRMHCQLSATKSERYLKLYSQQVMAINQNLEEAAGKLKNVTFYTHNGKFDEQNRNIRTKFGRDGIHLSACRQYQFYKSLRGALASSANRLVNILCKTKGSETRTEGSKNFHEGGG